MQMPITFLFRNGEPFKALMTDPERGEVVRVNMDNVEVDIKDTGSMRGASNQRFAAMRKLVIDYFLRVDVQQVEFAKRPDNTAGNIIV